MSIDNDQKDSPDHSTDSEAPVDQKEGLSEEDSEPNSSDFETKYTETYDLLLRTKAEMENLKKRTEKEIENAYKYSIESLLNEIIPVYDSLLLSSKMDKNKLKADQLIEGNKLLLSMFKQIFDKNNIMEINPLGDKFNPDSHQAVSTTKDNKKENDTVSEVVQQGYSLNGRVIKPALVIVVKNQ